MSNSTDEARIALVNSISSQLNRYMIFFIFLLGTIGSILNVIVLSQPALRINPCVLYFLAASVSSLGILLIGLPSRLVAGWTGVDPSNTSSWFCKSRLFFLYSFRTTLAWLLVFATVDRWLTSHSTVSKRRWSSCKIAWKSILVIYLVSCVLWSEAFYCYDANLSQAPLKCYGKSDSCRFFNDIFYASSTVAIPSITMLSFGLLTIQNINRSQRAIQPFRASALSAVSRPSRAPRRGNRRSESSLTSMLFLQVFLFTVCSLPQAIHQFYLTFTADMTKSPLRLAIENFIINFDFSLTYLGNGISFYIYTLNGTIFRQTLVRLIRTTIQYLKFHR